MNKSLQDKVATIASDTRFWVQAKAYRSNYNPGSLLGWCAIASAELHNRLTMEGIPAEIHMWVGEMYCHCFCVVNNFVVDVTASQFDVFQNDDVVIMHCNEAMFHEMYRGTETFKCGADLRRFQKRERWPSNQICFG